MYINSKKKSIFETFNSKLKETESGKRAVKLDLVPVFLN